MRAAIYTRISEDRFDQAEGVERQRKDCDLLARQRDIEVVAYFEDNNKSAMKGKRPAYTKLCAAVKNGDIDVVIVWKTDRLYRRLAELADLTDVLRLNDTPVYSVKSGDVDLATADGRLRANILGAVAQHESEVKGERVSAAAQQRVSKGRFNGGNRRFGYQHVSTRTVALHGVDGSDSVDVPTGKLELVPEEATAIKWACEYLLRGGSLNAIRKEWDDRGLRGGRGARFCSLTVKNILARPMNAGLATYRGKILDVEHEAPAIVSVKMWKDVCAVLDAPGRSKPGRPISSLLSGVLRCEVCLATGETIANARLNASVGKKARTTGIAPYIYRCDAAGHVQRRRAPLDAVIEAIVLEYIELNAKQLRRPAAKSGKAAAQEKRREQLRDQIAKWTARASEIDFDDFMAAVNPMRAELAKLDKAAVLVSETPATMALLGADDMRATWATMNITEKRGVISENVSKIVVGRSIPGRADLFMHNVHIFRARDGLEMEPAPGSFELDQPAGLQEWAEAMAASMPPMTGGTARRASAAIFKS